MVERISPKPSIASTSFDVVIVGSGHAGAQCAIALRQLKFQGSIAIVSDERDPPYERPPLSKEYLNGDKPFDRILIRPRTFWTERDILILAGRQVVSVAPISHVIETAGGELIGYGKLVWAAGGTARTLSCEGSQSGGVHSIRSRADVDSLVSELPEARKVVVIGGGYIGLEAASALVKLGKEVVLIESLDRVLARVTATHISRFLEAYHRSKGVDLRMGVTVAKLVAPDGRVTAIELASGELVSADIVIVGIGIVPAVQPLQAAGADDSDGVDVDAACRTALPDVYAIGDCARHSNRYAGGVKLRLESVQNASDQAIVAAKNIVGDVATYDAVPWFWSTQYDLKLQTIGIFAGFDTALIRGSQSANSFSVVYLKDSKVIALDCVNAPRDFVQGRRLILDGVVANAARLCDPAISLNDV